MGFGHVYHAVCVTDIRTGWWARADGNVMDTGKIDVLNGERH